MTFMLAFMFGVTLLTDVREAEEVKTAVAIVEAEDDGKVQLPANAREAERLVITSERTDLDRESGVIMFEGNAHASHSAGFDIYARQVYVFTRGSNELSRIVALGNVAITNENRTANGEMAIFKRKLGEIELYGGDDGTLARLAERGSNEIAGRKLKFWIDVEQVEIENSEIVFEKTNGGKVRGLK